MKNIFPLVISELKYMTISTMSFKACQIFVLVERENKNEPANAEIKELDAHLPVTLRGSSG